MYMYMYICMTLVQSAQATFYSVIVYNYVHTLYHYVSVHGLIPPHPHATGELATRQPLIASMRVVKKETLKLITSWVSKSQDPIMVSCLSNDRVHLSTLACRVGCYSNA